MLARLGLIALLTLFAVPVQADDSAKPARKPSPARQDKKPDDKKPDDKKPDDKKPDDKKPGDKKPDDKKPGDKKPGDKKPGDKKKDDKKKDDKKKDDKRKIDTKSEDAHALKELLAVDPKFGADKRVELRYDFSKPEQMDDWKSKGFQRVNRGGGVLLANGSRDQGYFIHELAMQGNFVLEVRCRIQQTMPSSQVVFLFGSGKSGAIFATGFAKSSRGGYRLVSRRQRVDKSVFRGGRTITAKFVVEDGVNVTAWVEGKRVAKTRKLKNRLDGRVGVFLNNMRFKIDWIAIRGEVDLQKLRR